jgi:uncharacterized protein (TIGR02285 family)
MNKYPLFFLLAFALLSFPVALSGAEDSRQPNNEINWQRAYFPPVTIPEGRHINAGFFDRVMMVLMEELREYKHTFLTANFKRITMEMEQQMNVCCPSLYKTPEREGFVAFSIPAMIVLPNGIIASERGREKLQPHMDENGRISLISLLKDGSITLGISTGRKYSDGLDEILQLFEGQNNLLVRSGEDVFEGLMMMMQMGRIDCLLGYPIEAAYFVKNTKGVSDFVYIPVKESTIPFTVGYIGCSNTNWGRDVIGKIDEIIKERRKTDFIDFYGQWLDDGSRDMHRKMATEYFESTSR